MSQRYYDILGIKDKKSSKEIIAKKYRNLSKIHHPDKVLDPAAKPEAEKKFKEIAEAYEVLSDDTKRQIYDVSGEEGLKQNQQQQNNSNNVHNINIHNMNNMNNLFDMFKMFNGNGNGAQQPHKNNDLTHTLTVSLKEMYTGTTKKIKITFNKQCICTTICTKCNGSKQETIMQQMGPMLIRQNRPCTQCNATGKIATPGCTIKDCKNGVILLEKLFEIVIEPQSQPHFVKIFSGENIENPNLLPGDFVVNVHAQNQDSIFDNNHEQIYQLHNTNDIISKITISLADALLGFEKKILYFDGNYIVITSNKIIKLGENIRIQGKGLGKGFQEGNLILEIIIQFPDKIPDSEEDKKLLRKLLQS